MKVAVWSPLPPAPSGIADHTAELLPALARRCQVVAVAEDPGAVDPRAVGNIPVASARERPDADLDLYQVGNSPAHVFVYRAALERPGVVVLHEWVLHDLVWREAADRGDPESYLREMRRSHGAGGSFVGRQVARGLGGTLLPARFPVNDRLLGNSLGAISLTRETADRLARRQPGLPALALVQHLAPLVGPAPSQAAARRALGLPPEVRVITAPGLANGSKRLRSLLRAAGRLRATHPDLRVVLAGAVEPGLPLEDWAREAGAGEGLQVTGRLSSEDLRLHLAAADVVSVLRFPSRGEMSAVLVRALGLGKPVLVTAGTPAAEEMPEGTVVPVDPGRREVAELSGLLERLLADEGLRRTIGDAGRRHVREHHGLEKTATRLAHFLAGVHERRAELSAEIEATRVPEGTMTAFFVEEVRQAGRELGLARLPVGLEPLLSALAVDQAGSGPER